MRILWSLLVLLSFTAFGSKKSDGLVIFTEEMPPYNFIRDNEVQGINIDIIKRACIDANIPCRFELYPWNRSVKLSRSIANSGLVSTSRIPKRENEYQWVGPLVASITCFYALADNNEAKGGELSELKNYTLGLQRGDVYEEVLKGYGLTALNNYVYFSDKFEYVSAFKAGRLDLFVASVNTLPSHLAHLNLSVKDIKPVFALLNPELGGNYLALNKKVPESLKAKLQMAVNRLMQPKQLMSIKSRYLGQKQAHHSAVNTIAGQCLPA